MSLLKNVVISTREKIELFLFTVLMLLLIVGFVYNYSVGSDATMEDCAPDYMTGSCSF